MRFTSRLYQGPIREKLPGPVTSVTGPQGNEGLGRRREDLVGSVLGKMARRTSWLMIDPDGCFEARRLIQGIRCWIQEKSDNRSTS